MRKEKSITIRLTKEDYVKLQHMSFRSEIPIAQIIRRAIKEFLNKI